MQLSLAVDPTNPNIVYLGGTPTARLSGPDPDRRHDDLRLAQRGRLYRRERTGTRGTAVPRPRAASQLKNPNQWPPGSLDTSERYLHRVNQTNPTQPYLNLLENPTAPFLSNSTLDLTNVLSFVNNGSNITWIPFDQMLNGSPDDLSPSTGVHQIVTEIDPVTGQPRLIVADDQGFFTGVITPGTINYGPGVIANPDGTVDSSDDPNGYSATLAQRQPPPPQFFYGAAQASLAAITKAGRRGPLRQRSAHRLVASSPAS